jgi:hypothetical protein
MHRIPDPAGDGRTTGDSHADPAAAQEDEQPLAPTNLREPELLALAATFIAAQDAELGFNCMLVKLYDKGRSIRDLAAACGLTPKTTRRIIDIYGPGVRELMEGQDNEEANSDSPR